MKKYLKKILHLPLTDKTPAEAASYPSLYLVLHKDNEGDWLDPTEEADLEEEAAEYERERYDPPVVAPLRAHGGRNNSQRLRWSQPPPYVPSPASQILLSAPPFPITLPPQIPGVDSLLATKQSLASQITQLRGVISLQKELKDLTAQIQTLQVDLLTPSPSTSTPLRSHDESPENKAVQARPPKAHPALVKHRLPFPVMTRSQGTAPNAQAGPSTTDNEDGEGEEESQSEGEEEIQEDVPTSGSRIIKTLKIKHLKELHSAVKNYGPAAPFTLSILEGLGQGGKLIPGEWMKVAQSVLSRSQYLTWKAELMEKLENQADINKQNAATTSWTLDKLTGRGKYAAESKQQTLPIGLLNQLTQAALAAWRAIPPPNSVGTSLSKIVQGKNEPYAQFVARLLEAAERILGENSSEDIIIKQLAFENANSACKAALRGKMKTIDLHGMIRLCNDVDSFEHKLSKSISLALGAAFHPVAVRQATPKSCFKCGKPGHFARNCIEGTTNIDPSQAHSLPKPPMPGLCPRCKKGHHWVKECRSKYDAAGQPPDSLFLRFRETGKWRGPDSPSQQIPQMQTGSHNPFVNPRPVQAFAERQQGVQDWTSVPPPPGL